jgi:hypothetical protein
MSSIDVFWEEIVWTTIEPGRSLRFVSTFNRHIPNEGKESFDSVKMLPEKSIVFRSNGRVCQVRNHVLVPVS